MSNLRSMVLQSFKKLHPTRMRVFAGDEKTLSAARLKINGEYSKNKHVKDHGAIMELIKHGEDVEKELKTQIIQAKEIKPGVYKIRITDETAKLVNTPFNESAVIEEGGNQNSPCCKNKVLRK